MAASEWAQAVGISVVFMASASVLIFRGPLGRAIGDRIAGRVGPEPETERLHAEVDDLRHRLAEVEERLDFAERALAQSRESERVGPGGS
jgi:hypothetical protein